MDRHNEDRATAYGSRARTLRVSLTNMALLLAITVFGLQLAPWLLSYPVVGLIVLRLRAVKPDRHLSPGANRAERFSMRLYQAWSWPLVVASVASSNQRSDQVMEARVAPPAPGAADVSGAHGAAAQGA